MGLNGTLGLMVLFALLSHGQGRTRNNHREAKLLFNIVKFQNTDCPATDGNVGTCYTRSECTQKKGRASGNCASGFGVCCVFEQKACDGVINENNTYAQNVDFPKGTFAEQVCTNGCSPLATTDVCQIRLDFVNLNIEGPNNEGKCFDNFFVASTTLARTPELCGNLGGQHMYLDTETIPGSDEIIGNFVVNTNSDLVTSAQTYKIKVAYIECNSPARAPEGCLQYFVGLTARIRSFNHGNLQIQSQNYAHCFRQEPGTCSFTVQEAPSSDQKDCFSLPIIADSDDDAVVQDCAAAPSYIGFPITGSTGSDMRCGEVFGLSVGDMTPSLVHSIQGGTPFVINFFASQMNQFSATGFDLLVRQIPC